MTINRQDQNYLKTLTVLYVEDDDDTREQFSEFLQRPVGTLITAADGAEGLEKFIRHAPDIIVTDILMPHMDGLTMSYEIRGIEPSVPIIVVTAFEQTDYLMRAIDIGIDKYVTKPVNSYLLFECLLECAHKLRAEEQLKQEHLHEIQSVRSKHHESVAILANGMAHDYNNLLQAILGYVDLAKSELDPESSAAGYLKQVEKSAAEAQGLSMLLNILAERDTSFSEHGMVMPIFRYTLEGVLRGTGIDLILDYPEKIPPVKLVEHQLHLVAQCLADNAVEAMPEGGSVFLSAQQEYISDQDALPVMPGNYLRISLADTGTGIAPDVLPKVFDPYFTTKDKGSSRGKGMSLALCHAIIIKHNGIITASSTQNNGAVFHIWLPAGEELSTVGEST